MKKYIVLLFAITIFSYNTINATSFSSYLPGGKNYFESDNFEVEYTELRTIDPIRVKRNTSYVFSFPGFDILDDPYVAIFSLTESYVSEYTSANVDCAFLPGKSYCTFTTVEDEEFIEIFVDANEMSLYYSYYELEVFQLEEGTEYTDYEEYIIPLIDSI